MTPEAVGRYLERVGVGVSMQDAWERFDRGVPGVSVPGPKVEGSSAVTAAAQGPLGLRDLSATIIDTRVLTQG